MAIQKWFDNSSNSFLKAVGFTIAATACYAIANTFLKLMSEHHPVIQIMFFRNLFAGLVAVFIGLHGQIHFKTKQPIRHIIRTLLRLVLGFCFAYGYAHMPLADVSVLVFTAPLFMAFLSIFLLPEKINPMTWPVLLIGFSGVLIALHPDAGIFQGAAFVVLAGSLMHGLSQVLARQLTVTDSNVVIVSITALLSTLCLSVVVPFFWVWPSAYGWVWLSLVGVLTGIGQLFLTQALRMVAPPSLAPYEYTSFLWSTFLGWLVWGDVPHMLTLVGAALIIVCGIYFIRNLSSFR